MEILVSKENWLIVLQQQMKEEPGEKLYVN